MKRIFIILAAITSILFPVSGQTGQSAYRFLEIPTSTKALGLGGIDICSVGEDITLAEQNPALLGPECGKQIAFGYMRFFGSADFASVGYGQGAGRHAAWSAALRYLNYGEMTGYDNQGLPTGTFTPADYSFEGTYSHDFTDRLRGGITMKGVFSSYEEYSAFALAVDLGLNYYNPYRDTSLSVVFKNMGGQLKRFHTNYDHLPFDIQLGWMKGFCESTFYLSVTARHLTKWTLPVYTHGENGLEEHKLKQGFGKNLFRHLVFGACYRPVDSFYAEIGYDYKTRTDMEGYKRNLLSGFSIGAGLQVRQFAVGVAYAVPHKSASTLAVNLVISPKF